MYSFSVYFFISSSSPSTNNCSNMASDCETRFRGTLTSVQLVSWLQAKLKEDNRPQLTEEQVKNLTGKVSA
jgi:hypothetical protein